MFTVPAFGLAWKIDCIEYWIFDITKGWIMAEIDLTRTDLRSRPLIAQQQAMSGPMCSAHRTTFAGNDDYREAVARFYNGYGHLPEHYPSNAPQQASPGEIRLRGLEQEIYLYRRNLQHLKDANDRLKQQNQLLEAELIELKKERINDDDIEKVLKMRDDEAIDRLLQGQAEQGRPEGCVQDVHKPVLQAVLA